MKRLFFVFAALLAISFFAVGCAQVDYPCITDNHQGEEEGPPDAGSDIDTDGEAHITEFIQSASIVGANTYEYLAFADQELGEDGGATSSTMTNYAHVEPNATFVAHSDFYCNTNNSECSVVTNSDNAFCGGTGTAPLVFDSCGGDDAGLFLLFGDSLRDPECGDSEVDAAVAGSPFQQLAGLKLNEMIDVLDQHSTVVEINGQEWNQLTFAPGELTLTANFANGVARSISSPEGLQVRVQLTNDFRIRTIAEVTSANGFASLMNEIQTIANEHPGLSFSVDGSAFGTGFSPRGEFRLIDLPNFYTDKIQ